VSDCVGTGGTAGQNLGGQSTITSAAITALSSGSAQIIVNGQPVSASTYYSDIGYGGYGGYDVSPSSGHLSIRGVGIGGDYSRTVFSDNASGLGYSRITHTAGITASYVQDFGDWGYSLVLPVTRSVNNSGYAAFDNTSIGLAVVPVYHLLFEQVDGIALDAGGVVGSQYTSYDHPSDLANGPIGLKGFENPASGQVGAFIKAAKSVAAATRLSLGAAFVDDHNFTGQNVLGQDTSVTTADLGMTQGLSSTWFLTADLTYINLNQYKWGIDRNYGQGTLALSDRLSPRASLSLQLSRTFDNSAWATTSSTVNFIWWLS
jgi:hypothetical protein